MSLREIPGFRRLIEGRTNHGRLVLLIERGPFERSLRQFHSESGYGRDPAMRLRNAVRNNHEEVARLRVHVGKLFLVAWRPDLDPPRAQYRPLRFRLEEDARGQVVFWTNDTNRFSGLVVDVRRSGPAEAVPGAIVLVLERVRYRPRKLWSSWRPAPDVTEVMAALVEVAADLALDTTEGRAPA